MRVQQTSTRTAITLDNKTSLVCFALLLVCMYTTSWRRACIVSPHRIVAAAHAHASMAPDHWAIQQPLNGARIGPWPGNTGDPSRRVGSKGAHRHCSSLLLDARQPGSHWGAGLGCHTKYCTVQWTDYGWTVDGLCVE